MVCFATQVSVTYHVRETASVYAASAPVDHESDSSPDTDRIEALEEEIVFLAAHIRPSAGLGSGRPPVLCPLAILPVRVQSRCGPRESPCGPGPG